MTKRESAQAQLEKAAARLREILNEPKSEIVRDSAILRFEIALDLSWKAIKALLEESHGIVCGSPKSCFREAFKVGLIRYEDKWLTLVELRNQTAHTYNADLAEMIYSELPAASRLIDALLGTIGERQA